MATTAMSRFGCLRTPLPADSLPQAQADAHASLLDALHVQKTVLVGVSAGAPSAMPLAIRHPQCLQALVLLMPPTWRPDDAPDCAAKLSVRARRYGIVVRHSHPATSSRSSSRHAAYDVDGSTSLCIEPGDVVLAVNGNP